MLKIKFHLAIIACLAVTTMFWSCEAAEDEVIPENPNYMVLLDYDLMVMRKDLGRSTWSGACKMCEELRLGGFEDWRLPTQGELAILYKERDVIGGFDTFSNYQYWSSTPHSISGFYVYMSFSDGTFGRYINATNHQPLSVRCVRSVHR